jgi:hypothetical protein
MCGPNVSGQRMFGCFAAWLGNFGVLCNVVVKMVWCVVAWLEQRVVFSSVVGIPVSLPDPALQLVQPPPPSPLLVCVGVCVWGRVCARACHGAALR